jgi:hypothetical protein
VLAQAQRVCHDLAELGEAALEVGVRSPVDDDLPAEELFAVEGLMEEDVPRAQ